MEVDIDKVAKARGDSGKSDANGFSPPRSFDKDVAGDGSANTSAKTSSEFRDEILQSFGVG